MSEAPIIRVEGIDVFYGKSQILFGVGLEVKKGQTVTKGQPIASVGTTGLSSGPHCHYEVHRKGKPINPRFYLPR